MKSSSPGEAKADYGNWVSRRLIYYPAALAVVFVALSFFSYYFLIVALPFLIITAYFTYAYFEFSPAGGDIQARIRGFVLDRLEWDGKGAALDIGCGNGALAVRLARKHPDAQVTGIDYWEGKWEYSLAACDRNASIEGVAGRTKFLKASATSLPFEDGIFDAAISNFVFHEVKDAKNKRDMVREALRTIKKGGHFAFQDLFPVKKLYGNIDEMLEEIKSWGIEDVRYVNTSNADFIPKPLKLPFMVGSIGIIYGRK
ncbi:MAG: class I SAM-dependent methyltransferase [Dehalococcoidia bacterium]|nr:class I SAM-dependent methyltransferase [Dehalococcoidia bacterium]